MKKDLANPISNFEDALKTPLIKQQLKSALGKNANAFAASLLDVYISDMQQYEAFSVIGEAMKAAVLNLPITKSLGFAYLVPYSGKVQFQLGYKGMIQLAMRSGQLKNINAGVIYEGEWKSTDKLRGVFDFSGEAVSDKAVGYFSYMELLNGFEKTIYWTKEQVVKHAEAKSPSYRHKSSAWQTDFDAMAIKTTLRALFSKYAPMSVDFVTAMSYDAESIEIEHVSKDITAEAQEAKTPVSFNGMTGEDVKVSPPKKKSPKKTEKKPKSKTTLEACEELNEYMKNKSYEKVVDAALDEQGIEGFVAEEAIKNGNEGACEKILKAIKAELEDKPAMP